MGNRGKYLAIISAFHLLEAFDNKVCLDFSVGRPVSPSTFLVKTHLPGSGRRSGIPGTVSHTSYFAILASHSLIPLSQSGQCAEARASWYERGSSDARAKSEQSSIVDGWACCLRFPLPYPSSSSGVKVVTRRVTSVGSSSAFFHCRTDVLSTGVRRWLGSKPSCRARPLLV